ncbi:hypothetical protein DFH07DRAFT_776003 [Mycena maculata]|uniref:Uncharacterized protein n=1 Tax=Mycena maculata TaxID=230809 RepID=A0AAD7IRH0_9AGAR|nr:hypothetical protein DFH07DRAFT_776003 [Mycena maculata]
MYSKLVAWGKQFGISVSRPDGPTVKAVANGALAWHLDASVASRIAKCHYGIGVRIPFNATNSEHSEFLGVCGKYYLYPAWSPIVTKNAKINVTQEFCEYYAAEIEADDLDFEHESTIYAYRRLTPPPFLKFPEVLILSRQTNPFARL